MEKQLYKIWWSDKRGIDIYTAICIGKSDCLQLIGEKKREYERAGERKYHVDSDYIREAKLSEAEIEKLYDCDIMPLKKSINECSKELEYIPTFNSDNIYFFYGNKLMQVWD